MLNQIVRVLERFKGDTPSKIGFGILSIGAMLIGGIPFIFSTIVRNSNGDERVFTVSASDAEWYVQILGFVLVVCGFCLLIHRYHILHKQSDKQNVGLFFIPGFDNINETIPKDVLPKIEQTKIKEIKFKKISSYEIDKIIEEYTFNVRLVKDRLEHSEVEKAYIAALGSIPFLYLTGTLFRNGHLPTRILEHDRSTDKWHLLSDFGPTETLEYKFEHTSDNQALSEVQSNSRNEIGLSISFSNEVVESELPTELQGHTLKVKLKSGFRFDAIPTESVQDEIVKELAHTITTLAKKAGKTHLFICAQASIILKLGKLYQDNMSGIVVIHNYYPNQRCYNWAIEFNRGELSIFNKYPST